MGSAVNTNVVFDEEIHQLSSAHKCDGGGIGPFSFRAGAWTEVAGGDDQALFVGARRPLRYNRKPGRRRPPGSIPPNEASLPGRLHRAVYFISEF